MTYNEIISNIPKSGSTELLLKLFGGQIYNIFHLQTNYSGPKETLLSIFGTMMQGVAFWMIVLVTLYIVISGLINQAQSGEFMSQSWNSVWSVLRFGMGVTSIIPLPGTSLVLIQAFVIAVAMISSSIADITWGKMLEAAAHAGIGADKTLKPSIDQAKTNAYLDDAYNYVICAANKIKYSNVDQSLSLDNFNPVDSNGNATAASIISICGGEKFQAFLTQAKEAQKPLLPDLSPAPGSDLISNDTMGKFNAYQKQQYDFLVSQTIVDFIQHRIWPFYISNMDTLNKGVMDDTRTKEWILITNDFNQILQNKIQSAIASNKEMAVHVFSEQASKYGWVSAGNYYRQLAQQQQIVNGAISTALENTPNYIDLAKQGDLTTSDNITTFGIDNSKSLISRAKSGVLHGVSNYLLDPLGINVFQAGDTVDPILVMTSLGQKLEGIAETLLIARQIPALFSWIPGVGSAINSFMAGGLIETIMAFTGIAGLVLGTILPSMPWIIFLFAVLSWLIYVAEMFVAAPFWIVANSVPEGHTFVSSLAKKGINNILFISLFPTLALGGLVASLAITWVGMSLVNHFIFIAFKSLAGLGTFPMTFIGLVFIYCSLSWIVILSSLNLIQEFPRKILNWISLAEPGLSPFDNAHDNVSNVLINGRVSGMLTKTIGKLSEYESNKAMSGANATAIRKIKSSSSEKQEC